MTRPEQPNDQQRALQLIARHHFYERAERRQVDRLVEQARALGTSWHLIGRVLGISRQGAQKRYGGAPDSWPDVESDELTLELEAPTGPTSDPLGLRSAVHEPSAWPLWSGDRP